jgi:hypothetical protein
MDYREESMVQALPMSYSYLHHNIQQELIQDSNLKFMPSLKRINTSNLVPIIDFEEYNRNKESDLDLKYILYNVYDTIPRLSEFSASTMLLRIPGFINEEMSFHKFPKSSKMDLQELKKHVGTINDNIAADQAHKDPEDLNLVTTKFFSKHGWDMILMQRTTAKNENKRATALFNSKENPLKMSGEDLLADPKLHSELQIPYSSNQPGPAGTNQSDLQNSMEGGEQQSRYISPHKDTILKKEQGSEETVFGNILVSAYNYRKDFKLKYSMNNHTISTNIETLYGACIEQVSKVLDMSDTIFTSASLKDLLHRKGLNHRFLWALLPKLKLKFSRELVMISILVRVIRRVVNEEIKLKSRVVHQSASKDEIDEYFVGNNSDSFKETLMYVMNSVLKRKFLKYKLVTDEALLGLFLSRMSVMGIVFDLGLKKEELIYFESKDILDDILKAPSQNPVLFINSV